MYVDFKIIGWERVAISEDDADAVKALLESGEVETANELMDAIDGIYEGLIPETDEMVSLEQNKGWATIEMKEKGKEPIFKNGK